MLGNYQSYIPTQIKKESLNNILVLPDFSREQTTFMFGTKKDIPVSVVARLHRWALFLSGCCYDIEYCNTEAYGNADIFLRLPDGDSNETNLRGKSLDIKALGYDTKMIGACRSCFYILGGRVKPNSHAPNTHPPC